VKLVAERGRLMQQAVPQGEGAMAAILGLDDDVVRQCCADAAAAGVVEAVNFNAPGQVVIAGSTAAVNAAIEKLKAAGAKRALPLPVSVPSHCALMKPAAEKLKASLDAVTFNAPAIPVVQNVNARIEADIPAMRAALIAQLYSPVQWVKSVEVLGGLGAVRALDAAIAYGARMLDQAGSAAHTAGERFEDFSDSAATAVRGMKRDARYKLDVASDALRASSRKATRKGSRAAKAIKTRFTH